MIHTFVFYGFLGFTVYLILSALEREIPRSSIEALQRGGYVVGRAIGWTMRALRWPRDLR